VNPAVQTSESVNIIVIIVTIEAQRKSTVNFSSLHLFEMENFDNYALFEFYLN
jgi:hypothetical protein